MSLFFVYSLREISIYAKLLPKYLREITMQIKEISKLNQPTEQKPLTIWENSVHATHKFLNNDEILQIRNYVPQAFKQVEHY